MVFIYNKPFSYLISINTNEIKVVDSTTIRRNA